VRLSAVIAARATALAVVAVVMTACSPTPDRSEGPTPSPEEQTPAPTFAPSIAPSPSSAAFEWKEPPDYLFTLDSSCGERALIGRFRVEVRDHVVVRVEGLNAQGRNVAASTDPSLFPTLANLMDMAVQARAAGAHEATFEFDPSDGNPTFVRIDRDLATIDDEECYAISHLVFVVHAL
jgi:hypothetical protein